MVLPTQETHRKVLLKRKALLMGLPPPEPELATTHHHALPANPDVAVRAYRPLIQHLQRLHVQRALCVFGSISLRLHGRVRLHYLIIRTHVLGYRRWCTPGAVGAILVDHLVYQEIARKGADRFKNSGPEQRLYIGMIGDLCLPVG
jgi:hypothetical protein